MLIPLLIWVLTIFNNGTPAISLSTTLSGGFVTLALPAEPQSYLLVLVNGTAMPYILNGTYVTIPVFGTANVSITYIPRITTMREFVGVSIVNNDTVEVVVPSNALVYNITLTIINMTEVNRELVIMATGPGEILYAITSTPAPTPPPTPPPSTPKPTSWLLPTFVIIVVVVVASVIVVMLRHGGRGRGVGEATYELNDYERAILNYLRSRGGSAFESDISKDLNIPRTTVWRSVRRLEGLGLVVIRKVEGKNLVVLKRRSGI